MQVCSLEYTQRREKRIIVVGALNREKVSAPKSKELIYMIYHNLKPEIIYASIEDRFTAIETRIASLEAELKDAHETISDQAELLANACKRITVLQGGV